MNRAVMNSALRATSEFQVIKSVHRREDQGGEDLSSASSTLRHRQHPRDELLSHRARAPDWEKLESAVHREDFATIQDYVHHSNLSDPSILGNPVDALVRHTYYRLAASHHHELTANRMNWPPLPLEVGAATYNRGSGAESGSRPNSGQIHFFTPSSVAPAPSVVPTAARPSSSSQMTGVANANPAFAARSIDNAGSTSSSYLQLSGPKVDRHHSTLVASQPLGGFTPRVAHHKRDRQHVMNSCDVRVAVDALLASPSRTTVVKGGPALGAREAEEREDIEDLEQYEMQIMSGLASDNLRVLERRQMNKRLISLGVDETHGRMELERRYEKSANDISSFLLAWRRGPAMAQNHFLISELHTRDRLMREESKEWAAMAEELCFVVEMNKTDRSRLRKLQAELSTVSILHQRVAFLKMILGRGQDTESSSYGDSSYQILDDEKNIQSCAQQ